MFSIHIPMLFVEIVWENFFWLLTAVSLRKSNHNRDWQIKNFRFILNITMGPFKNNSLLFKLTSKVILLSQCLKVENFHLVEGGYGPWFSQKQCLSPTKICVWKGVFKLKNKLKIFSCIL